MGAYIYRIKGTKAWSYQTINGTPEKVYDLVYWYKPYYYGMFESEPMPQTEEEHQAFLRVIEV